jgi:Right handed beta helix region/Fibronectin type III domain
MNLNRSLWLTPLLFLLTACPDPKTPEVLPAIPKGLTATAGDKQVTLAWKANSETDLKSYLLMIESSGDTPETVTVTIPATGTIIKSLNNDKSYSFKIAVENKAAKRSAYSASISATPKAPTTGGGGSNPKVKTPTGLSASAGDARVTLTWNTNSEADLKGYTLYWGTQPNTLSEKRFVNAGTTTTEVASLSNSTTYFFAVEAENTKGEKSAQSNIETATPTTVPTQPVIESFVIENNGSSLQVRQGLIFVVIIKGQRLNGMMSATLGSLSASVLSGSTDTEVALSIGIPHGQALGFLDLSVTTGNGTATRPKAIEVTEIAVAKSLKFNPDDNNFGTRERPFKTLSRALFFADSGDTVFLGVGTYSDGETWPVEQGGFPPKITPNVPAGVTIVGQIKDQVILEGPGQGQGGVSALVFTSSAAVRNLTVTQFTRALVHVYNPTEPCCDGDISLENLNVFENLDGFLSYQANTVNIKNSTFSINGDGAATGSGVYLSEYGDVAITDTIIEDNVYGLYATGGRSLIVTNVTSQNNLQDGFNLGDHTVTQLDNIKALENGDDGVDVLNNEGSFRMRGSELSDNKDTGITITGGSFGFASIDLGSYAGTPQDLGNNTLIGNTGWQIFDLREANTGITIKAEGNIIGGFPIPPDTYTATDAINGLSQVENGVKLWRIEKQGNSIAF